VKLFINCSDWCDFRKCQWWMWYLCFESKTILVLFHLFPWPRHIHEFRRLWNVRRIRFSTPDSSSQH